MREVSLLQLVASHRQHGRVNKFILTQVRLDEIEIGGNETRQQAIWRWRQYVHCALLRSEARAHQSLSVIDAQDRGRR